MPFELQIQGVDARGPESTIRGRIVAGGYAGQEMVRFTDTEGRVHSAFVTRHFLENPKDWPVRPGDGCTLVLTLDVPDGVCVDPSHPLVGTGAVMLAPGHVDIAEELQRPLFWALELGFHLDRYLPEDREDDDNAGTVFFGVSGDEQNDYYLRTFEARWKDGTWPRIRAELGDGRYVEYESAAGGEYQTRYWIGAPDGRSALLGYYSGHFSTPAVRPVELYWIAEQLRDGPYRHVPALLATVTYGAEPGEALRSFVQPLARTLPGVHADKRQELSSALEWLLTSGDMEWREDAELGWVNDGPYSQRNPDSALRIATREDYDFIRWFFRDVPA